MYISIRIFLRKEVSSDIYGPSDNLQDIIIAVCNLIINSGLFSPNMGMLNSRDCTKTYNEWPFYNEEYNWMQPGCESLKNPGAK